MDVRPTWTDCDEARDYVVPNVFSPRDLVSRPDNMGETVPHTFNHLEAFYYLKANLFKFYDNDSNILGARKFRTFTE